MAATSAGAAQVPPVSSSRSGASGGDAGNESLARKQRLDEFVRGVQGFEQHADALVAVMGSDAWDITCVETLTALSKEAVLRLLGQIKMAEGPKAVFLSACTTEQDAVRPGLGCVARRAAVDSSTQAPTLKLQTVLQTTIAAGWDANRFSEAFRLDQNSVRMIRRSASSLIQSRGVAQRRIVDRHCTGLLACSELLRNIDAFRNEAARLGREYRQAVVLTLLRRDAKHDAQYAEKLSFVAVALMHALLCDCTDEALRFLRDDAVVFLHGHGTVLTDDYHRAFCVIVIGSACDITTAPAVQSMIRKAVSQ